MEKLPAQGPIIIAYPNFSVKWATWAKLNPAEFWVNRHWYFIKLLTNDEKICIGHGQGSQTTTIQISSYIDRVTGRSVIVIDTPGFDDSREDVTDVDILENIVQLLEPASGEERKLNGIIYMHRISDPRVGGVLRKNLRMFRSLCGEESLKNVCIVTTNGDRVSEEEGNHRETDLKNGVFKDLLDAGAKICRHINTIESAFRIISEFIIFEAVATQVQKELCLGLKLADMSAGSVLMDDMQQMKRRREREMELAAKANDYALRSALEAERKLLEEKIERISADQKKLGKSLEQCRRAQESRWQQEKPLLVPLMAQLTYERQEMLSRLARAHEYQEPFMGMQAARVNSPALLAIGETPRLSAIMSEATMMQLDVEETVTHCVFLEGSLTTLRYESETLLREDAVPAMGALVKLVNYIETLHRISQNPEASVLTSPLPILGMNQTRAPLVHACKSQSQIVFDHFRSLGEKARNLRQKSAELATNLTYEISGAGTLREIKKHAASRRDIETIHRTSMRELAPGRGQKATAETHIRQAKETIRSAERKRDSVESARVVRNLITFGLGEAFDFFDLNKEIGDTRRTVASAEQHARGCEESVKQAVVALQRINDEVARLSALEATVRAQETTLQASVTRGQALRTRTMDLTNVCLDVSLLVGSLAAKSETFAIHHTAQEFARSVLSFGRLMVSEARSNRLLVQHDPGALQETLDLIAQSDPGDINTVSGIEDMM